MSKKKGTGWKHPKTGEKWSSKKAYHKYWQEFIKPKSKKQLEKERQKLEESDTFSEYYYRHYGYWSDDEDYTR